VVVLHREQRENIFELKSIFNFNPFIIPNNCSSQWSLSINKKSQIFRLLIRLAFLVSSILLSCRAVRMRDKSSSKEG
jgi:hypothetical protein